MNTVIKRLLIPLALILLMGCMFACDKRDLVGGEADADCVASGDCFDLVVEVDSVGVGTPQGVAVSITLNYSSDAVGENCTFAASAGSFESDKQTVISDGIIGATGEARVTWYPPDQSGETEIRATVRSFTAHSAITVYPIPNNAVVVQGLPDTVTVSTETVFNLDLPDTWAGSPVTLSTTAGQLRVVGVSEEGRPDHGHTVVPITDANGSAIIVFEASDETGSVIITVTAFGTQIQQTVEVIGVP